MTEVKCGMIDCKTNGNYRCSLELILLHPVKRTVYSDGVVPTALMDKAYCIYYDCSTSTKTGEEHE